MASSMAHELVSIIHSKPYKQIIPALPEGAGISERNFCKTRISRYYWLDTKHFIDGSYMNPNALFELFGEYSGDDSMSVRKEMLNYLGVNKKDKAANSQILKNAWISLHMKGLTANSWSDSMLDSNVPSDEIALYALCRLYDRHCMVYTRANIWSMLHADHPLDEKELSGLCDLHLMYIEPGVFGELKGRPFLPPPGPSITEKATTLSTGAESLQPTDESNLVSTIASLSECQQTSHGNAASLPTSSSTVMPPDQLQSVLTDGNVPDQIPSPGITNNTGVSAAASPPDSEEPGSDLANTVAPQSSTPDNISVTGNNTTSVNAQSVLLQKCTVIINKLSPLDCEKWLHPSTSIGGYQMPNRKLKEMRLAQSAKQNVCYDWSDSMETDSDDFSVREPVRKKPNKYLPLGGPSASRIAAQKHDREREAAETLLSLRNSGDESTAKVDARTVSNADDSVSTSTVNIDENSTSSPSANTDVEDDNGSSSVSQATEANNQKSQQSKNADNNSDSDNMALAEVQQTLRSNVNRSSSNRKSGKKAEFVETHHRLRKYKRKCKFKCSKCNFKGTSQGKLNKHFLSKHGNLICSKCNKQCQTLSALLKHQYDHSEIAKKHPCTDCTKAFPFASQLKSHRKVHLVALEHHCIHCAKSFKSKGELVKHLNKHSGNKWYCKKCTYSTNDPHNLRAHSHKHGKKTRYKCEKCAQGFNYYQQLKRHQKLEDCVSNKPKK